MTSLLSLDRAQRMSFELSMTPMPGKPLIYSLTMAAHGIGP